VAAMWMVMPFLNGSVFVATARADCTILSTRLWNCPLLLWRQWL